MPKAVVKQKSNKKKASGSTPTATKLSEQPVSQKASPQVNENSTSSSKKTSEKPSPKKGESKPERKIVYPKPIVNILMGDKPLTDKVAKDLLGWQEEIGEAKFDNNEVLLRDLYDKRVRCTNNITNRPFDLGQVIMLQQEILRGNYQLNMENIIIGKTGALISAQHRLIALVLACQAWEKEPDRYPYWENKRPVVETTIAFGCSEEDKVVNTVDTGKGRSDADVIYRTFYQELPPKERKVMAKRTEKCVQLLWHRTAAKDNAFAPIRTRAETLNFIGRHMRLLECVKHISDENGSEGKINAYIGPGTAAGLMYLMGCSTTEATSDSTAKVKDKYHDPGVIPSEKLVDWEMWDKANEFWVMLASGTDKTFADFKEAFGELTQSAINPSTAERCAIVVKAWDAFSKDEPIEQANLELEYVFENDSKMLNELPIVGGIDVGRPDAA